MSAVLGTEVHVPTLDELVGMLLILSLEVLGLYAITILIFKGLAYSLGLLRAEHVVLQVVRAAGRVLADKLQNVQLFLPLLAEFFVVDGGFELG